MRNQKVKLSEIRWLADKYEAGELERCIQNALQQGSTECLAIADQTEGVAMLSMAGFVRSQMEHHDLSVQQALRILGQRMRGLATMNNGVA